MIFAPHPDDETLNCGGIIAKKSRECEILVIFMTDGRNALKKLFGISSNPSPFEYKEIRKEEAKKAMKILGVSEENLIFLDIEDGQLKQNSSIAKKRIIECLIGLSFDELYFPSEKDIKPDHRATNNIVRSVLRNFKFDKPYEENTYLMVRKYNKIGPWKDKIFNIFLNNIFKVDISCYLPQKIKALNEYKTQIDIVSHKQKKPVLDANFLIRYIGEEETFFHKYCPTK